MSSLTLREVSERTKVPYHTVRIHNIEKRFPSVLIGNRYYVDSEDLPAYLETIVQDRINERSFIIQRILWLIDDIIGAVRMDKVPDDKCDNFQETLEKAIDIMLYQ